MESATGDKSSGEAGEKVSQIWKRRTDSCLLVWVLGVPTSRLVPPLPPPSRRAAQGWLQLADLHWCVSTETLLELLHQGLHCLLCRLSCCYRVVMGLRLRLDSFSVPRGLGLATLSL